MKRHSQIENDAAERLARRDSGNWTEEDEARLQEWIGASTERRVAYLRLKSTWDAAARLRVLRAGGPGEEIPAPGEWRRSPFFEPPGAAAQAIEQRPASGEAGDVATRQTFRRRRALFAVAAGVLLIVGAGFGALRVWSLRGDLYTTPLGGFASVPIEDGSKITLNTDSTIRVAITQKERGIELAQGEAFFEVAKDPARPFVVRAGTKRIIAVGTKFSVQNLGQDVRVLVTEGKVRVEDAESPPVLVAAGSIARAGEAGVVVTGAAPPRVEEFLSWREGHLTFHETVLADAVAEMNRYNKRKIFIEDPQIAALRISGTFRPTRYEAFVRVLEQGFSIEARTEEDRITLTRHR